MKNLKIALVTGRTGGHIFPAVALMEKLRIRGYLHIILIDKYAYERFFKDNNITDNCYLNILPNKNNALSLALSFFKSFYFLLFQNIDVVVGFGGYFTFPFMLASKILRKKCVIYENNVVMGKANRVLSYIADEIWIANKWCMMPQSAAKRSTVVCPLIRSNLVSRYNNSSYKHSYECVNILIVGGSQGAKFFDETITSMISGIAKEGDVNLSIMQQIRNESNHTIAQTYNEAKNIRRFNIKDFFQDIEMAYKWADFVVCRAGAATIGELLFFCKPAILIPYKYAKDNHQMHNGLYLCNNDACICVAQDDKQLLYSSIKRLISSSHLRALLASNAYSLYKEMLNYEDNVFKSNIWT